jgi:putative peptide zinc metalloprotease protein
MSSHIRKPTLFLLALVLVLGAALVRPPLAHADDEGGGSSGDNVAVAINTKSGSSVFKFAFSIRKVAGDVVDETNAAVAYSSCQECETTAIAIQIVLVTGNASVVTPQNLALAINEGCTLCETFAGAYQIVLGTGGPVRFSGEGRRRIAEITEAIRSLRQEDLSPAELNARLDTLVADLKEVLQTELVPVGLDGDEEDDRDEGEAVEEEPRGQPTQTEPTATEGTRTGTTGTTGTTTTTATTTTTPTEATTTGTTSTTTATTTTAPTPSTTTTPP